MCIYTCLHVMSHTLIKAIECSKSSLIRHSCVWGIIIHLCLSGRYLHTSAPDYLFKEC